MEYGREKEVVEGQRGEGNGEQTGPGFAPLSRFWRAADGWVRTHGNYPWHRSALLRALIGSTEEAGIWTIQSSIFPENTASLRLHQQAGFRVVGTRERIACHHGQWRDTVLIERRSPTAGTG